MLISDSYRAQQRQLHKERESYGAGAGSLDLVRRITLWGRRRALDYGAGKMKLADALGPAYQITGYDPCVEGIDGEPEPHPVVICSNVMEHVEPECVDAVLRHIRGVTQQRALFMIHCGPAHAVLPDGRNAHLVQQPKGWWLERLEAAELHVAEQGDGIGNRGEIVGCWFEAVPC